MIHFRKLNATPNPFRHKPSQNPRFQSTKSRTPESDAKIPGKATIKEVQAALLDYLHSTRSLQFLDADNMCKNSPFFLRDLFNKTLSQNPHVDTMRSIQRYLRYHPINEFEPFFESVGLKPSEYAPLLPRDMIYLNDDALLMENYHTLCNYGVPRPKMGKILKLAPLVFRYQSGVLMSKLRAYENLGVARTTLVAIVVSSPCILVGDVNIDFVKVVEKLKGVVAKDGDWVEGVLVNAGCCNWDLVLQLFCLLDKVFSAEQLGELVVRNPCVVFEESGGSAFSLIAFLIKFGLSVNRISLMFLEFPRIRVGKFLSNLRRCLLFFSEIEMQTVEIARIFQSHSALLGSFTLKRTTSLLCSLNAGKQRLCKFVRENPEEMKKWGLGCKIEPLGRIERESKVLKEQFLLSLGYVENSKKMNEVIKLFRGKGAGLQERYEFIVKVGLDDEVVRKMIRDSPRILNQSIDSMNMKIGVLVNEGYPISALVNFPSFLSYSTRRVKLRFSMYNWLRDHGAAQRGLALSTLIACSEKAFVQLYVNRLPSGLQVWQNLKAEISSEV
ncbi:transcription termination factor MTEF18, mitochondrial-like [Abrus precatorius]|uniref:Transcription termination factor MTEF18, mitochondrial-like n=1 Tax=Abrus precatorius TaxID=3816 RepID=A0A8B8L456_ABRPR|nr:transcription termination factor MTEF18, mitochondrial-like [Abrus precatorius]